MGTYYVGVYGTVDASTARRGAVVCHGDDRSAVAAALLRGRVAGGVFEATPALALLVSRGWKGPALARRPDGGLVSQHDCDLGRPSGSLSLELLAGVPGEWMWSWHVALDGVTGVVWGAGDCFQAALRDAVAGLAAAGCAMGPGLVVRRCGAAVVVRRRLDGRGFVVDVGRAG